MEIIISKRKVDYTFEKYIINYAEALKRKKLYPATVIGAQCGHYFSKSKSGPQSIALLHKTLKNQLKQIGNIGDKINNNCIGYCAEVNAANNLLIKKSTIHLENIVFTNVRRPRTMLIIGRCKNCKKTFVE